MFKFVCKWLELCFELSPRAVLERRTQEHVCLRCARETCMPVLLVCQGTRKLTADLTNWSDTRLSMLQPVLQCHTLLAYVAVGSALAEMMEPCFIGTSSSCASDGLQCHAMHLWGCLVQVCAVSSLGSIGCCRSNELRSADRATGHCRATAFA